MSLFDLRDIDRELAARHARDAEAEAARVPGIAAGTPTWPVERVAVVGAGTLGTGIAMAMANAGIATSLIDDDEARVKRALARVRDDYAYLAGRGRLNAAAMQQRLDQIHGATRLDDAADADLVIEAGSENLARRQASLRRIDAVARPGAILATQAPDLELDELASSTARPADVLGLRFHSPAHMARLLEVVRGASTAPDAFMSVMALGRRIGKVAVPVRSVPGLIGQTLYRAFDREAQFLVEDGALPHEVDEALVRFGYPMGIFAVHDMAGNDVGDAVRRAYADARAGTRRRHELILRLVEQGRLGQKCGKGWFRYEPGSRTPLRDPELEAFIAADSGHRGVARTVIGREEILQRCLFALVNEGAWLLEEGVALRPGDIDLVMLHGYGFPAAQGGPMFMADRIGLPVVAEAVQALHERLGAWWQPSPLLLQLASEGRGFAQWQPDRGGAHEAASLEAAGGPRMAG